jgi:DNA-binding transcriptional MocR family regulator
MLLLNLNHNNGTPFYLQIVEQIKDLVNAGSIKPGHKLPSTRTLAGKLGVNRSTVYKAYQELWALGYIDSRPGSYSLIRKRRELADLSASGTRSVISWEKHATPGSKAIYKIFSAQRNNINARSRALTHEVINLSPLIMDKRMFPVEKFRKCMNKVLSTNGDVVLDYGEHQGYKPLREYISNRLRLHSVSVSADEILITNGSQQGIDLILRLFTSPGSKVLIEEPTYSLILPMLKYYRVNAAGVPVLDDGLDLAYLEKYLKKNKASFLYTIPNFQNPTGVTTSQSHREALLELCVKYKLPLVEDGFEEEMKYFGSAVLPIKSMDKHKAVIYLGTFSKVLFPGIRIGWIAAERECIDRLLALKRFSDLTSSCVVQAAVYEFCHQGYYDLHIKRMHRNFSKRMRIALKALKKFMPEGKVTWNEPAGGYLIWIKLIEPKIGTAKINEFFLNHGVIVSPGEIYYFKHNQHNYFRISISTLNEEEIESGIKNLGNAICELYKS